MSADINAQDANLRTALHLAAADGRLSTCNAISATFVSQSKGEFLLQHKAAILADSHGQTPLHRASARNNFEIVELLLRHNANVDAMDLFNRTALMLAASNGFPWRSILLIFLVQLSRLENY